MEGRARLRPAAGLEFASRGILSTRRRKTIFSQKSVQLFVFDFGYSEDKRDIASEIRERMWPSLALAMPVFLVGLAVCITFALLMAFFRATYLDFWGVVLCVAMMSISTLFYIIGGQYVALQDLAPGADLRLRGRLRRGELPGAAGGDRRHQRHRLEQPLVPHAVPGGDGPGLRAHGARQGPRRDRRAVPPRAEERHDPDPDRRRGGDPAAVPRQPAVRILLRHSRASAATPSTRSRRRTSRWCARWCSSARCSTSSA